MVKNKSSEFTVFDDFGYSEEELEKYGGEYIEKQSCILFSAKEKNGVVTYPEGRNINISKEDLIKGEILKLYCKRVFKYLGENNPLFKNYRLSILDDSEESFMLDDKQGQDKYCLYIIRSDKDIETTKGKNLFLQIELDDVSLDKSYLTYLYCNLEWNEFREKFDYPPIAVKNGYINYLNTSKEFDEILRRSWQELFDSEEYLSLIEKTK